jgi:hypothetical protein
VTVVVPSCNAERIGWWRSEWPFVVCVLVAAMLRLHELGSVPLSAVEASGRPLSASAALVGLQSALFWLAGATDLTARLPVALAGTAVVLLPWRVSKLLGRRESIVLAGLVAVDPVSIGWSRLAHGATLAHVSAWTVLLCGVAAEAPGVSRRLRSQAAIGLGPALGLLLTSGPLAWDLLVPLLMVHIALRRDSAAWGRALPAAGITALTVSAFGFTEGAGPPLVSASVTIWLRSWTNNTVSLATAWQSLAGREFVPIAFGLAGLAAIAIRRVGAAHGAPHPSPVAAGVLLAWLAWAAARAGVGSEAWLIAQVPLFIGAAFAIPRLATAVQAQRSVLARATLTAACALLAIQYVGLSVKAATGREAADVAAGKSGGVPGAMRLTQPRGGR